jgi:hypothetical protein
MANCRPAQSRGRGKKLHDVVPTPWHGLSILDDWFTALTTLHWISTSQPLNTSRDGRIRDNPGSVQWLLVIENGRIQTMSRAVRLEGIYSMAVPLLPATTAFAPPCTADAVVETPKESTWIRTQCRCESSIEKPASTVISQTYARLRLNHRPPSPPNTLKLA